MPASTYDITIEQGATFELSLTWKDSDGEPVDLTGYTGESQLRHTYSDPDPVLEFDVTLGGATGEITVGATATETGDLPARSRPWKGVWDLELTQGITVTRLVEGAAVITPEVTK